MDIEEIKTHLVDPWQSVTAERGPMAVQGYALLWIIEKLEAMDAARLKQLEKEHSYWHEQQGVPCTPPYCIGVDGSIGETP